MSTTPLSIQEVAGTTQLSLFISVPYLIFSQDHKWVAPLKIAVRDLLNFQKNPFWNTHSFSGFIAYRGKALVGRVALIEKQDEKSSVHFGFLDFVQDQEVLGALMQAVEMIAKERGYKTLKGPFSPGINYEMGILTSGFQLAPSFMMLYNPPYYSFFLKALGYHVDMEFLAYRLPVSGYLPSAKMERVRAFLQKRYGARLRNLDYGDIVGEAAKLCHIYNAAFAGTYEAEQYSEPEFEATAKDLLQIMNRKLLYYCQVKNDKAEWEDVGFILALPDLNEVLAKIPNGELLPFNWIKFLILRKRIKHVKVLVACILPKYQYLGLGTLLYHEMHRRVAAEGYLSGELSWVAADNAPMRSAAEQMGGKVEKQYEIRCKKLK